MRIYCSIILLKNNLKFFLSGIFIMIACLPLKVESANTNSNIYIGDSSKIFVAENAIIYIQDHLFVKQSSQNIQKNKTKTKNKEDFPANDANSATNKIKEKTIIVAADFPFLPSSPSYFQYGKASALTGSQEKRDKHQTISETFCANTYPGIEKLNLSFLLEQKFSTAAAQCGILTSFSPNSPPL